jgi:hypothetical protein
MTSGLGTKLQGTFLLEGVCEARVQSNVREQGRTSIILNNNILFWFNLYYIILYYRTSNARVASVRGTITVQLCVVNLGDAYVVPLLSAAASLLLLAGQR